MAPTLFGRHKEVACEQCGYHYHVGASEEVTRDSERLKRHHRIEMAICPNCRYENPVRDLPVYTGDRILVNKFPYEIGDPERWDVFVFKYPEDPRINYIKRLVGLPGETLEIRQGDVYRHLPDDAGGVRKEILRKDDPDKQRLLQLLVYDNDFPARDLLAAGWPERWAPVEQTGADDGVAGWALDSSGWNPEYVNRTFSFEGTSAGDGRLEWIRYRHVVPQRADWDEFLAARDRGQSFSADPVARLISDFCAYNEYTGGSGGELHYDGDQYWVGDLTLSCQVDITSTAEDGELVLELNEGYRRYRVRFDLARATAAIAHSVPENRAQDEWQPLGEATTTLAGPGSYTVAFSNVDDRLCVWVDGELLEFEGSGAYLPYMGLARQQPTPQDLIPAGIAAAGADVEISHVLLERDIYYRAETVKPEYQYTEQALPIEEAVDDTLRGRLDDPQAWYETYTQSLSVNVPHYEHVEFTFTLGPDEFFALGDNSPRSQDSRLWSNVRRARHRHAVPREALVGKAFFIYWPHGVPFLNGGEGYAIGYHRHAGDGTRSDYPSFRVPFYPNVERMRRIR
ncbi:MAG: signal peptidase I [Planctomycetes bacterium]|nr:signal peptidase I [Planctomycetota bacterium]